MIRIKESTKRHLNTVENLLKGADAIGQQGIDLLHDNDITFVKENQKADVGISFHGDNVFGVSREKTILFKGEPPIYDLYFGIALSSHRYMNQFAAVMSTCIMDYKQGYHFVIPREEFKFVKSHFDRQKNSFLCMVLRNKKKAVRYNSMLPHHKKYKLYSNMGYRVKADKLFCDMLGKAYVSYGRGWDDRRFAGDIPDTYGQMDVFAEHKFSFVPENADIKGYITEKPINAMVCGSIPICYGPPDIGDYLPPGTYINGKDFSIKDLITEIKFMSDRSVQNYRNKIKMFVTSKQAEKFSSVAFAKVIMKILEENI